MNRCAYCQSTEKQVKSGKTGAGSQRWKCQNCGRRYTPEPKAHGYPDSLRQQAIRLYVDGTNYRRIGRILGVDHVTVMHWVRAHADQLPDAPQPKRVVMAEQDELFTFVGKKKTKSTS
jgi:transposase-like protein